MIGLDTIKVMYPWMVYTYITGWFFEWFIWSSL